MFIHNGQRALANLYRFIILRVDGNINLHLNEDTIQRFEIILLTGLNDPIVRDQAILGDGVVN